MTTKPEMYVHRTAQGFVELRQTRYRDRLAAGKEHPHDVCAVARDIGELRSMCEKHWPDTDWSADE